MEFLFLLLLFQGVPLHTRNDMYRVKYDDGRVFAEFARSVIEGKDIVLHTAMSGMPRKIDV